MSIYFEKARELGTLILESEESKQLSDAGAAFDSDEAAKARFDAYKDYRQAVQEKINNNEITQEQLNDESQKLSEMAAELKLDPVIAGLIFAEDNFNTFVAQIMNVLQATITGKAAGAGCHSDGCASCPGCSPGNH